MKARLEKKMTQAQLAQARPGTLRVGLANAERTQMINELPKVVQDYEAGKAMPNQQARLLARCCGWAHARAVCRSSLRWSARWECRCGRRRSRRS